MNLSDFCGTNTVEYVLDSGEGLRITRVVAKVNCLIVATSALRRDGSSIVGVPEREVMRTPSGGEVDLIPRDDATWLHLTRKARAVHVARSSKVIEEEEHASSDAPATAGAVSNSRGVAVEKPAGARSEAPVSVRVVGRETTRRGPGPTEVSAGAGIAERRGRLWVRPPSRRTSATSRICRFGPGAGSAHEGPREMVPIIAEAIASSLDGQS